MLAGLSYRLASNVYFHPRTTPAIEGPYKPRSSIGTLAIVAASVAKAIAAKPHVSRPSFTAKAHPPGVVHAAAASFSGAPGDDENAMVGQTHEPIHTKAK